MRSRGAPLFAGLFLGVVFAGACGEKARGGTAAVSVTDIELGRSIKSDLSIGGQTDDFQATDVIYASVGTSGAGPATLLARWMFEGNQLVIETSQAIAPNGPARTEFHLSKPGGLPPGRYRLAVMLNGRPAATRDFEVKD
jgi:hypothetical protein